jgi:choline/glycine/proline betaine transport protein
MEQRKPRPAHRFFDIHPPVFWPTLVLLIVFITAVLVIGEPAEELFSRIQDWISTHFGWFLVLVINVLLFTVLYFAFSRMGTIRLGGRNAVPDFSRGAWFAMLFSAGMGIGILFWGVAEPLFHFSDPPVAAGGGEAAAQEAMGISFLHWGLHAWGVYALVGLALAFFSFNRDMPLAFRSVFYPMLGERVHRWPGDVIDVLAVLATLFGLATSLGFGVKQVSAGLSHLFGTPDVLMTRIILIALITGAATTSVVLGLDRGVKRLSEINIYLAGLLLLFIVVLGPTLFIFDSYLQNIGGYLATFFQRSFWTESYQGGDWQNEWTIFYWSWWISWSPFVGLFIARISRGRTVREYVMSVLIVPALLTFLWITAFGGSALWLELRGGVSIAAGAMEEVATSMYLLFEQFPLSAVTNISAVVLVISFFITSSDSGSLVVDAFTSGGKLKSPVTQRVFWASMEGIVAAVLLLGGGLQALQTAAIAMGLPFAVILVIMSYSLRKGLVQEYNREQMNVRSRQKESYKHLIEQFVHEDTPREKKEGDADA